MSIEAISELIECLPTQTAGVFDPNLSVRELGDMAAVRGMSLTAFADVSSPIPI